jgi:hypothetical protein
MINTRHLVYPTPSDGNLRPNSDALVMAREGSNDLNRFYFHQGTPTINNRTSDPFNYTLSTGGYNNFPNKATNALSAGGIYPFPPPAQKQYIGNEVTNNPVPVLNALVDWRINPFINQLVDKPLPPQINPIAVP